MGALDLQSLGIAVFIIAAVLLVGVLLSLRFMPRLLSLARSTAPPAQDTALPSTLSGIIPANSAVLLIQAGGRVVYVNQEAREWFGLLAEEPNLERLARRTRPGELFLGLCAAEGQARFSLHGRFVDGQSFYLPWPQGGNREGSTAILVVLRHPDATLEVGQNASTAPGKAGGIHGQTLQVLAEFLQSTSAGTDVEGTLLAILETVERLISADFGTNVSAEITLWDELSRQFIPYRFVGLPGVDRRLEKGSDRYPMPQAEPEANHQDKPAGQPAASPQAGYGQFTASLASQRSPLLIGDTSQGLSSGAGSPPATTLFPGRTRSFLGTPLLAAGKLVGTLELSSPSRDAFTLGDLENLRFLSGPAALALNNALLYQDQQRRAVELSGLVQLAQAARFVWPGKAVPSGAPEEGAIGWLKQAVQPASSAEKGQVETPSPEPDAGVFAAQNDSLKPGSLETLASSATVDRLPVGDEYKELFDRLVKSIQPILDVESLGFWIWDPGQHCLEAQEPFIGFSSEFEDLHRLVILPGSPAEAVLAAREFIAAPNAVEDQRLKDLGLHLHAQVAGIHSAVLAPLISGDRLLGYLLVADKRDGSPFDPEDFRLVGIIAAQTATILENAVLARQTRAGAQGAGVLRHLAGLVSKMEPIPGETAIAPDRAALPGEAAATPTELVTLDDILAYALRELARHLGADAALLYRTDAWEEGWHTTPAGLRGQGLLHLHRKSLWGVSEQAVGGWSQLVLPEQRPAEQASLPVSKVALLPAYQPVLEALQLRSGLSVPLMARDRSLGELLLGSQKDNFFHTADRAILETAASQMASAIEQASLYAQTDDPDREYRRLRQRVDQLIELSQVSRDLNASVDLEHLLARLYDAVRLTTGADCGSILLFDHNAQNALPGAGSAGPGEQAVQTPAVILQIGDAHDQELSALEWSALQNPWRTSLIENFEPARVELEFPSHSATPDRQPPHAGVRASLLVPITWWGEVHPAGSRQAAAHGAGQGPSSERVIGLIHMHKLDRGETAPANEMTGRMKRFDETAPEMAQALAIQAAVALRNTERYQEQVENGETLQRRVETLANLFKTTRGLHLDQPLERSLEAIAQGIQESTAFETVEINLYDRQTGSLQRISGAWPEKAGDQFWTAYTQDDLELLLTPEYRLSPRNPLVGAYLIPGLASDDPLQGAELAAARAVEWNAGDLSRGLTGDLLLLSLTSADGQPLGLFRVNNPKDGLRPNRTTIETLEIFGNQAVLIIEGHRKYQESRNEARLLSQKADQAEQEMERARQATETVQSHLPALLRKDLEQTLAIHNLSQRSTWIRAGLSITDRVARLPFGSQQEGSGREIGSDGPLATPHSLQALRTAFFQTLGKDILHFLRVSGTGDEGAQPGPAGEPASSTSLVLVAEPSPQGPRLAQTISFSPSGDGFPAGEVFQLKGDLSQEDSLPQRTGLPQGVHPEALLGQRNPLRSILLPPEGAGEGDYLVLAANLDEAPEWQKSPLLLALGARSFICFSIPGESLDRAPAASLPAQPEAAVLVVLPDPLPPSVMEEAEPIRSIFTLIARQTSLALQNLRLQAETSRRLQDVNVLLDFSRQLGSLDPAEILATLLESTRRLIPAAHTGIVALYDPETGGLVPRAAVGYSEPGRILEISYSTALASEQALPAAPIKAFLERRPIRLDEVDFPSHYHLPSEDVIRYRDATKGRLPVSSLIIPVGAGPLTAGGQDGSDQGSLSANQGPLGIIILENFRASAAFTAEDQALITSLAQQTALNLENARARATAEAARAEAEAAREEAGSARSVAEALYQSAEARAAQLQALTNVAAAITSSLHTDELIASVLDLAQAVLPYDTGTLWIRQGDRLTVRAARGFEKEPAFQAGEPGNQSETLAAPAAALTEPEERLGLSVVVSESLLLRDMISSGHPTLVPDIREDARFPSIVPPRYLSWLGVPLISKGEVVGVIALEKTEAGFYTSDHIQAVSAFAGQASVALENARLYEESLARAAELDRRTQRLALLHRLSTELGSSLDATYILQLTIQELLLAVNGTGGEAFLFDTAGEILLQAESPQSIPNLPQVMPETPLFDRVRESLGVLIFQDIQAEPGWFFPPAETASPAQTGQEASTLSNYLMAREARALLVLPLATGSELHGLLFIHRPAPGRFLPEEVELARTISNQAAVAVQNAALFQETQWLFAETRQRSAELATLYDLGVNISQVLDREKLIDTTFENIQHLLQVDSVGLVMVEPDPAAGGLTALALENGVRIGPISLPRPPGTPGDGNTTSTGRSLSEWVLATGQPLLIGDMERDRDKLPGSGFTVGKTARAWLGVPLVVRGTVIGVLAAQSDEPDHFGESHLRLIGQIGNQLAVALDNARLFAAVQETAADLEQRVAERTAQLAREHQRTQTLLGIITELSTSLDMDIVLNRTLALINETIGAEHSMIMLVPWHGDNPQPSDDSMLYLRATLGSPMGTSAPSPKGGQPSSLRLDEGLAGWVISHHQPALVEDLWEDPRWSAQPGAPDGQGAHRSAIAVPLMMGEETLGALLLFHDLPNRFSPSQLDLVQATAKQIAVAINNAQLYTLIRDQAERLGDMLRRQHVETSRSQAILEAVADGVLVTDANRVMTLFNASAERILGLQREAVIGQSLEHFLGLFGSAGHAWMDTIRRWSEDPTSLTSLDPDYTYTEQIELEDMRVVSVHLSPVRLRSDFLGTVSTFRDITHQVVVDRLKSEFVATVSHELRTPMTSIKGYVEILLMGAAGKMTGQQTRFLEIVKNNTERLAVLVNDLLDISRIEAGRVTLSLQPVDLRQLAREVAGDYQRRNEEENKGMDIQVNIPADLPRVLGDAERLRQILDNLLDNAYSYTPEGGRIGLTLHQSGDEIQVDVQDNGIGIHPEDQPRLFERFYRGENPLVLATSGTGLGLSIVRHLVEMHKGRIWLKSNGILGEGSTFSFTIPIYHALD